MILLQSLSICNQGLNRSWLFLWVAKGQGQGQDSAWESTVGVQGSGFRPRFTFSASGSDSVQAHGKRSGLG